MANARLQGWLFKSSGKTSFKVCACMSTPRMGVVGCRACLAVVGLWCGFFILAGHCRMRARAALDLPRVVFRVRRCHGYNLWHYLWLLLRWPRDCVWRHGRASRRFGANVPFFLVILFTFHPLLCSAHISPRCSPPRPSYRVGTSGGLSLTTST